MSIATAANVAPPRPRRTPRIRIDVAASPTTTPEERASSRRNSLVGRLASERDKPLAVIVAPPGYGKSTLVREWARLDERRFVWSSGISGWRELLGLIRSSRKRHPRFVLVLDSADQLEPDLLSEIVLAALGELPGGCMIAVVSRTEPQLPLGRLRAHRMLTEVRASDLALTRPEAEALLRREGVELPAQDVDALMLRTEGWPAALYLAVLCLRDDAEALASFSGQQHLVFDYLNEEVLAHLPDRLIDFAVRTSVLEELSGAACDAVLEARQSGLRLAELAAVSPLMRPIDPNHHRYRWHPLVREALRSELRRTEPEIEAALHRQASIWYATRGDTTQAIDHAAASGDARLAGDQLFANVVAYLSRGNHEMVGHWLTALGDARVASYAPLALSASLHALAVGDVGEAKRWSICAVALVERMGTGKSPRSLSTAVAVVQALMPRGNLETIGELAERAIAAEPGDSQWQSLLVLLCGVSAHLRGHLDAAATTFDDATALGDKAAPIFTALCLAQRAMIAIERGEWDVASEVTDRATTLLEDWGLARDPISALVFAAAAASRAHHGRVDEAKRDVRLSIGLMTTLGEFVPWYGAETRILLAHASLWLADVVRARALLAEASRLARRNPDAVIFAHWFDEAWACVDTLAEARLAGPSALTIAELRVLRFLPSHRSFREIADQLEVSANTVKTQAHAVYRKLGVASRSEAVARAVEAGLLG